MEWGFMSTTSDENVAREVRKALVLLLLFRHGANTSPQYSGAKAGETMGVVLCLESTSIDRGGCIKEFSQYEGEVEYLFVPCSFVEPTGLKRLEDAKDGEGLLWMIHVRVNANLKSFTVEELKGRKKQMHVAAFDYLLAETERALVAIAGEDDCVKKWEGDGYKQYVSLNDFIKKIINGGKSASITTSKGGARPVQPGPQVQRPGGRDAALPDGGGVCAPVLCGRSGTWFFFLLG